MLISVVIPLLNEEGNLRELHRRLVETFDGIPCDRRIILVNDGSSDGSDAVIQELCEKDPTVHGIHLSRNFGHEAASTAGLDAATGDACVLMDADLQDPPEVIVDMVAAWQAGNDIVYAQRNERRGETSFKRSTSWLFYRLLRRLTDVDIPKDVGDFRLIDKKVLTAVQQCRENDRFLRGLIAWTGFRSTAVKYDRPARFAGETKYNPIKLLLLAIDAGIGFSILPLRVATAIGFAVMVMAIAMAILVFVQRLFNIVWMNQGYALLATGLFFLGGVQIFLLGVLGEYIGRIYRQSQNRPLYIVGATTHRSGHPQPGLEPVREAVV